MELLPWTSSDTDVLELMISCVALGSQVTSDELYRDTSDELSQDIIDELFQDIFNEVSLEFMDWLVKPVFMDTFLCLWVGT